MRILRGAFARAPVALLAVACGGGELDAPRSAPTRDGGTSGAGGAVGACGQGTATTGQRASAILDGVLDTKDPAVVALNDLSVDCQRAGIPRCTGTLIGADRVVTAGHCLGFYPQEFLVVLVGPNADLGAGPVGMGLDGLLFRLLGTRAHPMFSPETLANDVAVLKLNGRPAVTPVPLWTAPIDASLVGSAVRIVGYGVSNGGSTIGAKREGKAVIASIGKTDFTYAGAPSMTCGGDSGGPVFATREGVEYLIGVTSRGDAACKDHGVAVRVDTLPAGFVDGPILRRSGAPHPADPRSHGPARLPQEWRRWGAGFPERERRARRCTWRSPPRRRWP